MKETMQPASGTGRQTLIIRITNPSKIIIMNTQIRKGSGFWSEVKYNFDGIYVRKGSADFN